MAGLHVPKDKRVALVDTETWLFPQPTLDALQQYLSQAAVDPSVLQALVSAAVAQGVAYSHDQPQPTADWVIPHSLGFKPSVTIVDTAGTLNEGAVSYPDDHTVRVQFNAPFAGQAFLS